MCIIALIKNANNFSFFFFFSKHIIFKPQIITVYMKKRVRVKVSDFKKGILIGIVIGLIIGIVGSIIFIKSSGEIIGQEVKSYCSINPITLYGLPCKTHADCYGRSELCSITTKHCAVDALIDKTQTGNIKLPSTKTECESLGGTWKVEIVKE